MPDFIQREVRERARNPSQSDNVTILVGYSGDDSVIIDSIRNQGGEVQEQLPFDTLKASVPEAGLESLMSHPSVETVELDDGMETLQGN
jgi:hypothetical protein